MARSMTVGPLRSDQVARLLHSYQELAEDQAEVKAQLVELAPAWAELRKVLNELNRVLEDRRVGSVVPTNQQATLGPRPHRLSRRPRPHSTLRP